MYSRRVLYKIFYFRSNMSNINNHPTEDKSQNLDDFQSTPVSESKFWRKVKQDPVVPIGILKFHFILCKICLLKAWLDLV